MGFIHDKLDVKLLILYLLSRTDAPIEFSTLTDLALCDPGVVYFEFAEAVEELIQTGHIAMTDGLYEITEKGRQNIAHSESSLSPVIRKRCDRNLIPLNTKFRRNAKVRAAVEQLEEGKFLLRLSLDDDKWNLMTLTLTTPTLEQSEKMAEHFRAQPENIYLSLIQTLLSNNLQEE